MKKGVTILSDLNVHCDYCELDGKSSPALFYCSWLNENRCPECVFAVKDTIICVQCETIIGYTLDEISNADICDRCLNDLKKDVALKYNNILDEFTKKQLDKKKRKIEKIYK